MNLNQYTCSIIGGCLKAALVCFLFQSVLNAQPLVKMVDPFIGTAGQGNTYPGAQAPFGMISISPNSVFENYMSESSYESRSGYNYYNDRISGFSLTHFSGIGCHAMQDLPVTFTTMVPDTSPVYRKHFYSHTFEKADEHAEPGYYSVAFDNGVRVEATSAIRSGIFRVSNASHSDLHFLLNPNGAANGITNASLQFEKSRKLLTGWARTGGFCDRNPENHPYTIYFAFIFSHDPEDEGAWEINLNKPFQSEIQGKGAVFFNFGAINELIVRVGISFVSSKNAIENLERELLDLPFDTLKYRTAMSWEEHLSKVIISDTGQIDIKKQFYTAMYHNMLQPSIFQDVNGEYVGFDDEVHTADLGRNIYTNFSLWDTYRTSIQLQSILFPDRVSDMVRSLLLFTEQSHGGLPVWALHNTDNGVMNGYSAVPFIANARAFGADDFDLNHAIFLMKKAALKETSIKEGRGWEDLSIYVEKGFLPQDLVNKYSVSKMLEYSIADYSLAALCRASGDSSGYEYFLQRSEQVFEVFNVATGYFQPKMSDGHWMKPFEIGSTIGFNEGNAGQYNFSIQQHWTKFVELFGGKGKVKERLDQYFEKIFCEGWYVDKPNFWVGNEPSFGAQFHYSRIGYTEEAAVFNEKALSCFSNRPDGLPGNDDSGALSALFVFCTLGVYPSYPAEVKFDKIEPLLKEVVIQSDIWTKIMH